VEGFIPAREAPQTFKIGPVLPEFLRFPFLLLGKVGLNPFHMFQVIDDGAINVSDAERREALLDLLGAGALFVMLQNKVNADFG